MKYGLYNTEPVIRTVTGKFVNVFDPKPEMFDIVDIAHALSHQCRFGGHLPYFFSVAEHSVDASVKVMEEDRILRLTALMHDASEAYLMDIPRPIKLQLAGYKPIEDNLMKCLSEVFGFMWPLPDIVKEIDEICLQSEWDDIMLPAPNYHNEISRADARQKFLSRFNQLKP